MTNNKEAVGGNPAARFSPHKNNVPSASKNQITFDKASLPKPSIVLTKLGIRHTLNGDWLVAYCPFHKEGREQNPSLRVNATSGHYKCHACGEKGGDVIALYRRAAGTGFGQTLSLMGVSHG